MAVCKKVHMILTKYSKDINQKHYVIYLQNMKFVQLILWPGGAYTDDTYATTVTIAIPYYDSFHESRLYRLIIAKPNEPTRRKNAQEVISGSSDVLSRSRYDPHCY